MVEINYALNTIFFLISGAMVMWMAAGFTALEAGSVRTKNVTEILTKNVALFSVASIAFLLCGYNIMYGWNEPESHSMYADFFFQMVFVATAMSVVSGAVAERKNAALARRKKEELEREYAANPEEFAQKSAFLGNQIAGIWNAAQEEKRKAAADKEFVAHQEAREKEAVQKEAANLQKARDQALESASLSSKGMLNRQGDWSQSAKQYLVIAHEDATPSLKGRKGIQVECREVKGKQVEASKSLEIIFNPMCTDQNGELRTLSAPIGWVQYITELEAKTAQYNTKKQCTWANAELAKMILSSFSFEPKHSVPYDDLYELYAENVDAGIAEIEFRLLPGLGLVVVPASLAHLLAAFTEDSHGTIEEAESRAKYGDKPLNKYGETEKLAEVLSEKAEKGTNIIVPVTQWKTLDSVGLHQEKPSEINCRSCSHKSFGSSRC